MPRRLLSLFAFSLLGAAAPTHALIITGNFTGYHDKSVWMSMEEPGDGHLVSGSFFLNTAAFEPSGSVWNIDPEVRYFSLVMTEHGYTQENYQGAQRLIFDGGPGDTDSWSAFSYFPGGYGSELWLFGELFDAGWTLPHAGKVNLATSYIYEGYYTHTNGSYYRLTSMDYTVSQLPEPGSLSLLALALGSAVWRRKRSQGLR